MTSPGWQEEARFHLVLDQKKKGREDWDEGGAVGGRSQMREAAGGNVMILKGRKRKGEKG